MKRSVMTRNGMAMRESERKPYGPADLLVRTLGCGVCEGDVVEYKNRSSLGDQELRPGHEGIGVVEEVGCDVEGFGKGDTVTCLAGAYAEYFTSPAEWAVKVPDGLDWRLALGEPLSCVVHAMNRLTVGPRDRAAIMGCGFMGLLALQVLKNRGVGHLCGIDPILERREQALAFGAAEVYAPEDAPLHDDVEHEGTFDIVVEASGVQAALDLAGNLVAQHGAINILGTHRGNEGRRTVHMYQWNWKAITVHNGHVRRTDEKVEALRESVRLLADGTVDVVPLVKYYALEDADQAFRDLVNRKPGVYKAVLVP